MQEFCQSHNIDGKKSANNFECYSCKTSSYPWNLSSSFICTHKDNESNLP